MFGQVLEENHHLLWRLLESEVFAINWPGFRYETIKDRLTRANEQILLIPIVKVKRGTVQACALSDIQNRNRVKTFLLDQCHKRTTERLPGALDPRIDLAVVGHASL